MRPEGHWIRCGNMAVTHAHAKRSAEAPIAGGHHETREGQGERESGEGRGTHPSR
jgi:hypothetical protein